LDGGAMANPEIIRIAKIVTFWNIALVVGAVLTAISTYYAIRYNDKLQSVKDDELSHFQTEAQKEIARANEAAAIANQQAQQLSVKSTELTIKAKSLELQVEQEKIARLKIEERFAPREISAEKEAQLVKILEPLKGEKIFVAFTSPGNPEVQNLAERLATIFKNAGWDASDGGPMTTSKSVAGVSIYIGKNRRSEIVIKTLAHFLDAAGLRDEGRPFEVFQDQGEDMLALMVGPKH
jgi:hypothetical protein